MLTNLKPVLFAVMWLSFYSICISESALSLSVNTEGKYGYKDSSDSLVIPFLFDLANNFSGNYAGVAKCNPDNLKKSMSEIQNNNSGDVANESYYLYGDYEDYGYQKKKSTAQWGFINKNGKIVIDFQYDDCQDFSGGLACVKQNVLWGFIDTTGKEIIPFKYSSARGFSDGVAAVKSVKTGKWGFISRDGKEVLAFSFEETGDFADGLCPVKILNKWGAINKTGDTVIKAEYDKLYNYSYGLSLVSINKKSGFINTSGKIIVPIQYDDAYPFAEGFALVKLNGLRGFYNRYGDLVFPLKYTWAVSFKNGYAEVSYKDKRYSINKYGEPLDPKMAKNATHIINEIMPKGKNPLPNDSMKIKRDPYFYPDSKRPVVQDPELWSDFPKQISTVAQADSAIEDAKKNYDFYRIYQIATLHLFETEKKRAEALYYAQYLGFAFKDPWILYYIARHIKIFPVKDYAELDFKVVAQMAVNSAQVQNDTMAFNKIVNYVQLFEVPSQNAVFSNPVLIKKSSDEKSQSNKQQSGPFKFTGEGFSVEFPGTCVNNNGLYSYTDENYAYLFTVMPASNFVGASNEIIKTILEKYIPNAVEVTKSNIELKNGSHIKVIEGKFQNRTIISTAYADSKRGRLYVLSVICLAGKDLIAEHTTFNSKFNFY